MIGLICFCLLVMYLLRRFSVIPVASMILATHARPGDLFSLDRFEPGQHDPLVDDFWNSNELASVPDLTLSLLAEDRVAEPDDINLFTDFSSDSFATDPSDLITSSSACNPEGSLTNDFLQARDDRSCSTTGDIDVPNIFDENFLPQGLGTSTVEQKEQPSQESVGKQPGDPGWAAYGLAIPKALQLQENRELCTPDTFGVSIIPVCNNPVTGRVEYETAKLYATLVNIIPYNGICPPQEVWCCSIIRARSFVDGERSPTLIRFPNGAEAGNLVSLLNPEVAYDGLYCHPLQFTKNIDLPVSPLR